MTRDAAPHDADDVRRRLQATLDPLFDNVPLPQKLARLLATAFDQVVGVDGYAVRLVEGDAVTEATASGGLMSDLHALETRLEDGPCLEVMAGSVDTSVYEHLTPGGTMDAPDARGQTYRQAAAALGVRAQVTVRLRPRRRTFGVLTVVSTSQGHTPVAPVEAALVGSVVSLAVDEAVLRAGIEDGLRGRTVIGTALGVLMERYRLDEDAALAFLKRESSTSNRKLRQVAEELVAAAQQRP